MISRATTRNLNYYSRVRTIAISILFLTLALAPALHAQVHGVPPSVTSFGPGRGFAPGVPASVTSLGPNGFGENPFVFGGTPVFFGDTNHFNGTLPDNQFFRTPNCCAGRVFPLRRDPDHFRRRPDGSGSTVFYPYPVPAYAPYYPDMTQGPADDSVAPGPTMFDRNGQAWDDRPLSDRNSADRYYSARRGDQYAAERPTDQTTRPSQASTEPAKPAPEQPATLLVFKDGHKLEVKNYVVQGDVLYDLTPGHARKVALSDLDLQATQKENEDRGTDFQLPAHSS